MPRAVLRDPIYMLVDRQPSLLPNVQKRYEHVGRQLFEDVNAWFAVRDVFMDMLCEPGLQAPCVGRRLGVLFCTTEGNSFIYARKRDSRR
jgi:hypothetical protein